MPASGVYGAGEASLQLVLLSMQVLKRMTIDASQGGQSTKSFSEVRPRSWGKHENVLRLSRIVPLDVHAKPLCRIRPSNHKLNNELSVGEIHELLEKAIL